MSGTAPSNPASLAFPHPDKVIQTLVESRLEIPSAVTVTELQRALSSLLYTWLNNDGDSSAVACYAARLLHLSGFDHVEASALGDQLHRVALLRDNVPLPDLLGRAWAYWERMLDTCEPSTQATLEVRAAKVFEAENYAADDLGPIRAFAKRVGKELAEHCLEFVIHGSLSDLQRTAYSDLDTWLVLRRETLIDPDRLIAVQGLLAGLMKLVHAFDPLQHHGVFVASEPELRAYRQARLPLVLLETSTSLLGAPTLQITLADDGMEKAHHLFRTASRVAAISQIPDSPYDIKMVTSWLMLLPALHHQVHRDYCYKPDGIAAVSGDFSEPAWRAVEAATEIRQRWGEQEPRDLVRAVEPDLAAHAAAFGRELVDRLKSSPVKDQAWDQVVLGPWPTTNRISATDHPAVYSLEDFERVVSDQVARLGDLEGVRSVWTMGSAAEPTLGISDLDLLVVLQDDPLEDPTGREIFDQIVRQERNLTTDPAWALHRYIKCHQDFVICTAEAVALADYWSPAPRLTAGDPLPALNRAVGPETRRHMETLLLFKEGTFQLLKLIELVQAKRFPLRMALLRAYSVVHDIRIARDCFGISNEIALNYDEAIRDLRRTWFERPDEERVPALLLLTQTGFLLLHQLLAEVSNQLLESDLVTLEPLDSYEQIDQEIVPHRLRFTRADVSDAGRAFLQGRSPQLQLPMSMLPIIYHCRPYAPLSPMIEPGIMASTLTNELREPAVGLRAVFERQAALTRRYEVKYGR